MHNIPMDELDRRLQRPHDPAKGSWGSLFAAFGGALRGLAVAFNPFLAVGGFLFALVAGAIALSFVDQVPTLIRVVAVLAGATVTGYLAGKFGNAILFVLALAVAAAALAAGGFGIWVLLS